MNIIGSSLDISNIAGALSDVYVQTPTMGVYIAAILACLLLVLSGFASGSEIAFFSLSPNDLAELDPERNTADRHIQMLRDDSERTLATILITNNFVNVTIIMLCNYVFGAILHFGPKAYWVEFLCITVILTFLLLLYGEIIPKVYSRQNPLKFCRRAVGGILFARKLFWPIENLLLRSEFLAEKVVQKENHHLSVDDLEQALELTDKEEIKDDQSILQGIIRFGDETAKEVMTSRQDIVDLDIRSNFSDVLKCIVENNYSRIPIYQDNEDHIRGILYIKDLLPHLNKSAYFRWQSLIRPPYFVPETKKIDDLLREFQENKVHIAIVVDEFGGTSGLITLEDILEEIVGEINDEFDEEEKTYSKMNYNTYIFEGKTLLSDFCKILDIDDDEFSEVEGDADSLAGLLLELKGDFPSMHEKIDYKNYTFEVFDVEERRISKIKVIIHEKKNGGEKSSK
jgi:gliding motility-associated protein GldE